MKSFIVGSHTSRRNFLQRLPMVGLLPGLSSGIGGSATTGSEVREVLRQAWLADTHEHTLPESERVRMTVDLFTLISHYTVNDLISAGLDARMRSELLKPAIPVLVRWKWIAPYWEKARNTGYARALQITLRDIYGAAELNERTCEQISQRITASNKKGLVDRVMREKARIRFAVLDDYYNVEPRKPESSLFVTARRFDRFVSVTSLDDLQKLEEATGSSITTLAQLEKTLEKDFERNLQAGTMAAVKIALAYSRPLYFRETIREDAEQDFEQVAKNHLQPGVDHRFDQLTEIRAKKLQDFMLHRLIQLALEHGMPVQVHTGLQSGNGNFIPNANPTHLVNLFFDYPKVQFDLFHAGYPYLSEMATLAKNFPNVYVDLCWMHIISPSAARRALHEYLETVPSNKILGFGGDYRFVELTYGHSVMAKENMIRVLEEKVRERYFTKEQAVAVGKRLFHDNAAELFLLRQAAERKQGAR